MKRVRAREHKRTKGEEAGAPYFTQHAEACAVERWLAGMLGVKWDEYSQAFERLGEEG